MNSLEITLSKITRSIGSRIRLVRETLRRARVLDRAQHETSFDERNHYGKLNDADEWTSRDRDTRVSLRIDRSGFKRFASLVLADRQSAGGRRVPCDDEHPHG